MQQVSLIIVNWNTGSLLLRCLESIASLPEQDSISHVVVIDNASKDTSIEHAKGFAQEHGYAIFKEKHNLGFAKANNLGWQYIKKHGGDNDHILLLNPDTELYPGALTAMLAVLEKNVQAGIVGSKLLESNGEVQHSVRTFPTLGIFVVLFLKLQRVFPSLSMWKRYMMTDFDYTKEQLVNQVMGAAFLVRNSVLQKIGLLDESFWIWFEEVDLCKRAKDAGWNTVYTPNATVLHHGGTSFNQLIGLARTKPFLNSSLVYTKKHLGGFAYATLLALYPFALGVAAMASMIISPHPNPLPVRGEGKYLNNELAWGVIALTCVLFLFAIFGIETAVFSVLGVLVLWWAWEYPEESFLTLIILSPLLPLLKVTQTLGNITLVKDVIIITLFIRNFLFPLLTQKLPYRRNLFFAPMIALGLWACFEVLRAGVTTLSILRLRDITLYMLLYFGVLYLPHTASRMKVRCMVFLATLGITIALGVFQFLHLPDSTVLRFDPARQIWIPRIASTFAHPTVFAEYLITGAMVIIGILLPNRVIPGLTRNPRRTIFLSIFLLTTIFLLYFTYTRAAWIGFAVGVGAIGITYFTTYLTPASPSKGEENAAYSPPYEGGVRGGYATRRYFIISTLSILLVTSFALFQFTPVGTFIRSGFDSKYASNADRIVFIVQLISQTSNTDAVIGKGLGNTITKTREGGDATAFDIASGESRTIQLSKDQTLVDNQYLKTFIEMGVVGIVFTFWLFWRFFLASKKALEQNYALGIACIGFLAAFIIQALFVDIWDVYPTNALFWTLAALVSHPKESQS